MSNYSVSEIYCYPIKGCGGISLQSAELEERGVKYDRRWMLVDSSNQFISQRSHKVMSQIKLQIQDEHICVTYPGMEDLEIPVDSSHPEEVIVRVWDDEVNAYVMDEKFNRWFSKVLEDDIRLVKMEDSSVRNIDTRYASNGEQVSFADGYPYLIIGQSSLDHLNAKLGDQLGMNRFRPNIVFTGGEPHEEDHWNSFEIGSALFRGVKPCARCTVTTINQETGETGKEPLKTLSTYRKAGNKILFGFNAMLGSGNRIQIGDSIRVHTLLPEVQ